MLGYISRSGWADRVLEGKTRHSTLQNQFEMAGTRRRPPGRQVGWQSVRIRSVWLGGLGLQFCWTPLGMTHGFCKTYSLLGFLKTWDEEKNLYKTKSFVTFFTIF